MACSSKVHQTIGFGKYSEMFLSYINSSSVFIPKNDRNSIETSCWSNLSRPWSTFRWLVLLTIQIRVLKIVSYKATYTFNILKLRVRLAHFNTFWIVQVILKRKYFRAWWGESSTSLSHLINAKFRHSLDFCISLYESKPNFFGFVNK